MAILDGARADGLELVLTPRGTIKVRGDAAAIARWSGPIRERKPEIIAALENPPTPPATPPAKPPSPILGDRPTARVEHDQLVRGAAHAFHNHLFGPGKTEGCCFARSGRYCPEGARLRAEYRGRVAESQGGANG